MLVRLLVATAGVGMVAAAVLSPDLKPLVEALRPWLP
ncbi:hypothetical protein OCOJLMKI_4328 [Methylobacterium iners]|uniref:Uncharacterized protein n=1 Tax=Methylobacterium iners TaxID=418707 RepID=A0ABQ4S1V7_9HYPH|nr:hypothetical protein OCOJLMKI_4328 [Methylobacterium iners]